MVNSPVIFLIPKVSLAILMYIQTGINMDFRF